MAPCHSEAAAKQVQKRCAALNKYLCNRAQFGKDIETLASPVTGGGIGVNRFQQLFLLTIAQGKKQPAEWVAFTWQLLMAQGQRLVQAGKTLESADENIAELTKLAEAFAEKQLPILRALQVA